MKEKILVVTVGGTRDPVVTAYEELQPDHTVFVVTQSNREGDGSEFVLFHDGDARKKPYSAPREELKTAIIEHLELQEDQYSVVKLESPDNVAEAYKAILHSVEQLRNIHPNAEVVMDYTGGSKSMSVAAAMVANDEGLQLSVVQGNRYDLVKTWGDSYRSNQSLNMAQQRRYIRQVQERIASRNYSEAANLCKEALVGASSQETLETKLLRKLRNVALAFADWDVFKHAEAVKRLRMYGNDFNNLIFFASDVDKAKELFKKRYECKKDAPQLKVGVEIVADIYLNAIRRGEQEKYDDAVGRFYRALELQAQVLLIDLHGISTGNVRLEDLKERLAPEELERLESKWNQHEKIQIGLMEAYELLERLEQNKRLKPVIQKHLGRMKELINYRNNSILAHGMEPVSKESYEKFLRFVTDFFQQIDHVLGRKRGINYFPQLPNEVTTDLGSL